MRSFRYLLTARHETRTRTVLAAALAAAIVGAAFAPAAAGANTVVVNTTTDQAVMGCPANCSLRDAVAFSNPGDTITIPAGHYVLTLGDIPISQSLKLAGAGARVTVIDGNHTSGGLFGGIFNINGFISVELDDLSLVNGVASVAGTAAIGGAVSAFGQIVSTRPLIFNPVALTIRRCTIDNNQAGQTGGVSVIAGTLDIENSTISHNSSSLAGSALGLQLVTGSIVNSTISGNSTGSPGTVEAISSTMRLINNTITANQASNGAGINLVSSPATLSNNIIAGNAGGNCGLTGSSATTDHNLDDDNSCQLTGPGDLPGVNPVLGPLADYGGPTDTHPLLAGSPAIDAGNNATCPPTDQRGTSRPQGARCDIGAYEDTTIAIAINNPVIFVNEGQTVTQSGTVHGVGSDASDAITLTASVGTVINNGDGTWSWSLVTHDPQSLAVTITAQTADGAELAGHTVFQVFVLDVPPTLLSVTNNGPIVAPGSATITVNAADTTGDNDTLSYSFDCDGDGVFEIGPQASNTATCSFSTPGSYTVNVQVTDGEGGVTTGSTVVAATPNCTTAVASPNLLWPPNNKLVPIQISGVTGAGGGAAPIVVTSIFQDEPVTKGPDATGVGTATPSVRAQRDGSGDGRVYHISFTSTSNGVSCTGSVTVGVPHDQGKGSTPIDEGSLYDSTLP